MIRQTDRPSKSANLSTAAATPAAERLLKARISNDCVRSCPNTQLVETLRVTLRKDMWPLRRVPDPSGGAHAMLLLISSTSQSCPPHVQASGGPFDVIGAQLLPIGYNGDTSPPSIKLTNTLELLTVLPKLPPALRRCLPAACPQPDSATQLESTLQLEFAILVSSEGASTPARDSPEALLEHMGMGPRVSLGVLFLRLLDAADVAARAVTGAKVEPYLLRAQRAAGGCLQLRRYDAGTSGSGDVVMRLRAPPAGRRQRSGALQGPRAGFGAPVQYSSTVHEAESAPLFSAHTASHRGQQDGRRQLTFPMQCTCTSFGPYCAALAREGVLFPATYTFARAPPAKKGARITVTCISKCHELLRVHVGACPDTFELAATEGQGGEEHRLDLCLPGGHPAQQRPLLEGTILVACDDSGDAAREVRRRGAAARGETASARRRRGPNGKVAAATAAASHATKLLPPPQAHTRRPPIPQWPPGAPSEPISTRPIPCMIANRFVSSWAYAELAQMQPTPSITLPSRSWPLNAPVKPDDAIFFLITTSKSCYDQEVAGGPYHVIGTTLQPIASVVGATGRVMFHSTLELLKVLPRLPAAMRAHMDAVQVDVAILIPDYGHPLDRLISRYAHLSLGPNVFCGTIFLHQHGTPAACRKNVSMCKMNAEMRNTNEACPLLDAYAAPARGTLEPEGLLLLPYSSESIELGPTVLTLATIDQNLDAMLVSQGAPEAKDLFPPLGLHQPAASSSPVLFPLQCNCRRCGFCCTAFARDGMFFTGTYTKDGTDQGGPPEGAVLHSVAACHKLFMQHIGPDLNGAPPGGGGKAVQEGTQEEVHIELHAPAGTLAGDLPLPEGTVLTMCEGSSAPSEAFAAGVAC